MNLSNCDFGLLFLFKTCVEAKSFSKASEIMSVKQPAISYSMKKLEELLNVKLFDRGNYGIKLTEEGKILYEYVTLANNNILSGLSIVDELSRKEIIELRIGVSLNLALTYISETLQKLKKVFPKIRVSIYSKDEEIMLKLLQEKKLDVVVFNSSRNNVIPGLTIKRIKNNEIVCAGTKDYLKLVEGKNKNVTIPLISPSNSTNLAKELTNSYIEQNIEFIDFITCHSAVVAKELILSGIGIGYINKETIKNELKSGELVVINQTNNIGTYSIDLATQEKNLNVVIKQFIKIFKEIVGDK